MTWLLVQRVAVGVVIPSPNRMPLSLPGPGGYLIHCYQYPIKYFNRVYQLPGASGTERTASRWSIPN
ncbi:unnamed protein product [Nezara viridula]|uniref:Uncharacterized protein n=1 Tax=Nezara viridula TaxID=85310 RepID=A0A9P0HCP7_NEZVI|nr:unnamed protein product [Nezara viridula]